MCLSTLKSVPNSVKPLVQFEFKSEHSVLLDSSIPLTTCDCFVKV